jgi:hypothetical protein
MGTAGPEERVERAARMAKVTRVEVSNSFCQCPECGYQNGFHIAFKRIEPNGSAHKLAVHLICPSCSATYDIALTMCLPDPKRPQGSFSGATDTA